ncbi:MAG: hypothetical protein M3Q68_06850 [Actinomycetota bacterium]|nr:hypothetical protein [Actinomycetota bacterium]
MTKALPSLAYHFGIRPWEVQHLTFAEIREFTDQANRLNWEAASGS